MKSRNCDTGYRLLMHVVLSRKGDMLCIALIQSSQTGGRWEEQVLMYMFIRGIAVYNCKMVVSNILWLSYAQVWLRHVLFGA